MPSFRVELAPLPFEKIENICDAFGPNDTRFMDERVGINFKWADKIQKLIKNLTIRSLNFKIISSSI